MLAGPVVPLSWCTANVVVSNAVMVVIVVIVVLCRDNDSTSVRLADFAFGSGSTRRLHYRDRVERDRLPVTL